jgi:nucleotide-binding universal stress UspA family protein
MDTISGTIVAGVDGSESSTRALHWAVQQAAAEHRALTLVHATRRLSPAFNDGMYVDTVGARAALEADGRQIIAEARKAVEWQQPDLEVHEVFEIGDPREVLLHLGEHAAMVVVGSRGRGRVKSLLLGSVSVAVIRHAHCPVVVVRPWNQGLVRNGVAVGVDAFEPSQPVLEFAYRQASLHDLPLTIVHCLRDILAGTTGAYIAPPDATDVQNEYAALAESRAGMAEKYPDVHVTSHVANGLAEEVLVELGEHMDLVVTGTHHAPFARRVFDGSVSIEVVEHASCPVAVVPLWTSAEETRR